MRCGIEGTKRMMSLNVTRELRLLPDKGLQVLDGECQGQTWGLAGLEMWVPKHNWDAIF